MPRNRKSNREIDTTRLELKPSKAANDSKIRELASKHRRDFYMGFYEIGRRAKEALDLLQDKNRFSGVSIDLLYRQFAEETGVDEHTLRTCEKVVSKFTRGEFNTAIAHEEIYWTHFHYICQATTEEERDELIALVCSNRWTPPQLEKELLRRRRASHLIQPRQPRPPRNVKIALKRLQGQSDRFLRDAGRMFSKNYNLPEAFVWTFQGDVTETLRDQTVRDIELLEAVAKQAADQAARLRISLSHVEYVLKLNSSNDAGVHPVG